MFSSKKPNYLKLRTNLRLCINRLKLMEKKKTELALKARKEIADYIRNGKEDRARIRVEHIIREDYLVEAMEIIEMFCDMLLARFGLIEKMREMDPGLEDPIATVIWVTPRLSAECQELREVSNQFGLKYGKEFMLACQNNTLDNVNEKVLLKLSTRPPPARLVEMYMTEIAKSYDVPFESDPILMEEMTPAPPNLIDFDLGDPKNRGGGGGGGGGNMFEQPIYDNAPAVPRRSDSFPSPAGAVPGAYPPAGGAPYPPQQPYPPAGAYPPPPQGYMPSASAPTGSQFAPQNGFHGQNGHFLDFHQDPPASPPPTYYPPSTGGAMPGVPPHPAAAGSLPGKDWEGPPIPSRPPGATGSSSAPPKPPRLHGPPTDIDRLPSYEELHGPENAAPAAPQQPDLNNLPIPPRPEAGDSFGLPNVPTDSVVTVGDEIDFDDLTKRFENLKKK